MEYAGRRYDSCANRCYYASFQAAIHALQREGIGPSAGRWGHDYVAAQTDEGLAVHVVPVRTPARGQ